jgi:hypothetical protein
MSFSTFGRAIGINVKSTTALTDATLPLNSGKTYFAGRPVTIVLSGSAGTETLVPFDADSMNVKVVGLGKFNKNPYSDEGFGASTGMYGSTRGTFVAKTIVEVSPNYFTNLAAGTEVTVANYTSDLLSANPMAPLYVSLEEATLGQITATLVASGAGQNDATMFGYLLVAPSSTNPVATIMLA